MRSAFPLCCFHFSLVSCVSLDVHVPARVMQCNVYYALSGVLWEWSCFDRFAWHKNLKLAHSLGLFWWSELRGKACRYQNKGFGVGCHNVMSNVSMGRGFDRDLHTHQISYPCNYTWTKQRPNVIKGLGISARRFGALLGSRFNAGIPSYSASDSREKLRDSQGIHTSPLILSGGKDLS